MSLDLSILIIRTSPEQRRHLLSVIEASNSQTAAVLSPLVLATEPGGVEPLRPAPTQRVAPAPSGSDLGNSQILRGARAC